MTNETNEATNTPSATPASEKDEQDQVFGTKAEERKEATAGRDPGSAADKDRPAEPHAGGKA